MPLPEKDWFTYAELAAQWVCSEEHIAHYVETGKLAAERHVAPGVTFTRGFTVRAVSGERVDNDRVYLRIGEHETLFWVQRISREERNRFEREHGIGPSATDDKPEDANGEQGPPTHDWRDDPTVKWIGKQKLAIAAIIDLKKWNPLAVPIGEKGTIELLCRAEYSELFEAPSAFERAWKSGLKEGRWRMQSHASYSRRR